MGSISYRDLLTAEDRARIADAAGCTPLQWLLSVMLDPAHPFDNRVDCAKTAAPYMHRKMPIAVELPNQASQVDVSKLLALPRDEREKLLATLTKLGVNLGVGAAPGVGTMPTVVAAAAGVMASRYAEADEVGKAMPPGLAKLHARSNARVKAALDAGKQLTPSHRTPTKPAAKPKAAKKPAPRGKPKGSK